MENRERMKTWGILELMGHRRLGGFITEEEHFGAAMVRIDVPGADSTVATQYYGGHAIYCLTPTTEETARAVARESQPEPVTQWDARRLLPPPPKAHGDRDEDDHIDDPF